MIPFEKIFAIYSIPRLSTSQRIVLANSALSTDEILNLDAATLGEYLGIRINMVPDPLVEPRYYEAGLVWASVSGNRFVTILDPLYPPLLREISDPPFLLTYLGSLASCSPSIAVVGTRNATELGRLAAYAFGLQCADAGISVISGFARGIDSAVQKGVISAGGVPWAVIGGGLDYAVKQGGQNLTDVLDADEAILSEFHPISSPLRWHFPLRNRVISGIVPVTLVIQAPERSGALITADHALRQVRDVLVHRIGIADGVGSCTFRLAEDGARIITSLGDVMHPDIPQAKSSRPVQFLRTSRVRKGYEYRYGAYRLGFSMPVSL